jgi:ABC-type transport system involved in multi-copper enzyme maturation permease subunit
MTVLPVIVRELRSSARHAFTYYLRTIGAGAALLACMFFGLTRGFDPNLGGLLFGSLHTTLFWGIWLFVPLLTADCISRERREGTLGLLFLTQLKASDIVVAKGLAHGLRALTLWLAILPVAAIPILLGGVSWIEALLSIMINFSALCWALAVGLLASAWSTAWLRALLRAAVLTLCSLLSMAALAGWFLLAVLSPTAWRGWQSSSEFLFVMGLHFIANPTGLWANYAPVFSSTGSFSGPRLVWTPPGSGLSSTHQLLWGLSELTALSLLVLFLAILLAGRKTRRVWQEEGPSRRSVWLEKIFCTPVVWVSFFRRWMRRKLERNPIGWLEQRTWSGRLVTWGWLAVLISLYSAVLTDRNFFRGSEKMQETMAWMLAGSMAMSAANSFRRERDSGVMELLLVSPLAERQIIWGRLRGLWSQFLPAFVLLLGVWYYLSTFLPYENAPNPIAFFIGCMLCLPMIGLYFSLRCRHFIAAYLAALAVGLLLPFLIAALFNFIDDAYTPGAGPAPNQDWSLNHAIFWQVALAALCLFYLHRRLKKRNFPLERTEH